ncbi:MAG: HlyD family efflux transporter periplasmic adaptor subunit [Tissierellaceae bacterium]
MTYDKRKRKRTVRKSLRKILILIIFIYFISRSIPIALAKNAKTILPEKDILVKSYEAQGILIKEEEVYTTVGGIDSNAQEMEGERVPAGFKVANVSISNDISGLKEELKEIERAIDTLNKSDREIGLFEKVKNSSSDNDTLLGQSLEALNSRKEAIIQEISSNKVLYTTSTAGLLSFNIDGYENLYIPKEFENYTYENLDIPKEVKKKEEGEPKGFKLINNFQWFLAIKIDNPKEIKEYEVGNLINVEMKDGDKEITGRIIEINRSNNKMVIIVKFTTHLEEYYNLRFPKVKIIMSKNRGFKIPTKTLVENEGQKGVYIKEFSGIVKFRPVSIIESMEDYTFVNMGDGGYIELKKDEKPVRTISLYDEIFLNPSNIKEGQILD